MTLRSFQKLLSANDVGLTGTHQSGFLIPKGSEALSLFPSLDEAEYNPDARLTVHTPQTGEHWELRFVHYNNRRHGQGTRDEYRVTGTARLFRALNASAGDILTISRGTVGDLEFHIAPPIRQDKPREKTVTMGNGWSIMLSDPGEFK